MLFVFVGSSKVVANTLLCDTCRVLINREQRETAI